MVYLRIVHKNLGNYSKAEILLIESLKFYRKYHSKNYRGIAWDLESLGNTYIISGKYEKARELIEESLKILKEHFLENHVARTWSLGYLANACAGLGDYTKAKDLLEEVLIIYKKYLSKYYFWDGKN